MYDCDASYSCLKMGLNKCVLLKLICQRSALVAIISGVSGRGNARKESSRPVSALFIEVFFG